MRTFVQNGGTIRYSNTGAEVIPSGAVVILGGLVTVANGTIAPSEEGVCVAEGVHLLPKATGATISAGDRVIWDASAGGFAPSNTTLASGDVTGGAVAWEGAVSTASTVLVKIGFAGAVVP